MGKTFKVGKKSKGDGDFILIILVIALVIAVLFAVVVPPLLPLLWLIFELGDRSLGIPKSARAFALTRAEWDELENTRAALENGETKGAAKRKAKLEELEGQPAARWKSWVGSIESLWGNRIGLALGFIVFVVVLLTRQTPMNAVYAGLSSEAFIACGKLAADPTFLNVTLMILPLLAWLIGAFIGWSKGEGKAKELMPEPGPVGAERSPETELANEEARQEEFNPIGGQAAGIAVAAITCALSLALIIAAFLGKV